MLYLAAPRLIPLVGFLLLPLIFGHILAKNIIIGGRLCPSGLLVERGPKHEMVALGAGTVFRAWGPVGWGP